MKLRIVFCVMGIALMVGIMATAAFAGEKYLPFDHLGTAPMFANTNSIEELQKVILSNEDDVKAFMELADLEHLTNLFMRAVRGDKKAGRVIIDLMNKGRKMETVGYRHKIGTHKGEIAAIHNRLWNGNDVGCFYVTVIDGPQTYRFIIPMICGNICYMGVEPTKVEPKPVQPTAKTVIAIPTVQTATAAPTVATATAAPTAQSSIAAPTVSTQSQGIVLNRFALKYIEDNTPRPVAPIAGCSIRESKKSGSAWPWIIGGIGLAAGGTALGIALVPHHVKAEPINSTVGTNNGTVINNNGKVENTTNTTVNNNPPPQNIQTTITTSECDTNGDPADEEPPSKSVPSSAPRLANAQVRADVSIAPAPAKPSLISRILNSINVRVTIWEMSF